MTIEKVELINRTVYEGRNERARRLSREERTIQVVPASIGWTVELHIEVLREPSRWWRPTLASAERLLWRKVGEAVRDGFVPKLDLQFE